MKEKKVHHALASVIIGILVSIAYIAALTFLLPLTLILPEVTTIMYVCMGVILVCVFVLFWLKKDFGATLINLGFATLLPGIIGLIMGFAGEQKMLIFIEAVMPKLLPYLRQYITAVVPSFWFTTIGYVVIGIFLYIWGSKTTRKKTMLTQIKKLFPKAKF